MGNAQCQLCKGSSSRAQHSGHLLILMKMTSFSICTSDIVRCAVYLYSQYGSTHMHILDFDDCENRYLTMNGCCFLIRGCPPRYFWCYHDTGISIESDQVRPKHAWWVRFRSSIPDRSTSRIVFVIVNPETLLLSRTPDNSIFPGTSNPILCLHRNLSIGLPQRPRYTPNAKKRAKQPG